MLLCAVGVQNFKDFGHFWAWARWWAGRDIILFWEAGQINREQTVVGKGKDGWHEEGCTEIL